MSAARRCGRSALRGDSDVECRYIILDIWSLRQLYEKASRVFFFYGVNELLYTYTYIILYTHNLFSRWINERKTQSAHLHKTESWKSLDHWLRREKKFTQNFARCRKIARSKRKGGARSDVFEMKKRSSEYSCVHCIFASLNTWDAIRDFKKNSVRKKWTWLFLAARIVFFNDFLPKKKTKSSSTASSRLTLFTLESVCFFALTRNLALYQHTEFARQARCFIYVEHICL